MISKSLVKIKECAISTCPACPPLRGTATLDVTGRFPGRRALEMAAPETIRSTLYRALARKEEGDVPSPVGASTSQRSGLREPLIAGCGLLSLLPQGATVERPRVPSIWITDGPWRS
jgi:hypothetical protein